MVRLRLLLGLVTLATLVSAPAQAADLGTLQRTLKATSDRLGRSSGALVTEVATGKVLYSRRPDLRLAPASNEKLYTTAAALLALGAQGTTSTQVRLAPGASLEEDGTVRGDLVLVGGGDPSLSDAGLSALAGQLDAKVTRLTGGVLGDEGLFDLRRGSFDSGFAADLDIGGQLGALTVGHGRSGTGGPAGVAAGRLQAGLKAEGIRAGRRARVTTGSADPTEDAPLAILESPTMGALAASTNVPSDNFYAETLLKLLGARVGTGGTTAAGAAVVRATVKPFGIAPTVMDGSGLSRADRTSPRELVGLLSGMSAQPAFATFRGSLPVPGRTGTLRTRMRGTAAVRRCQAKTGTLRGVSALSGYCTTAKGTLLAFSLMENGVYAPGAKAVEDRMVPAIAGYDG